MTILRVLASAVFAASLPLVAVHAQETCQGFGPQTPRDLTVSAGTHPQKFVLADEADDLNLCNIHFHTNAEHKAVGFAVFAGPGKHGGYQCNETASLTPAELSTPKEQEGACHGVKPGDTIEVHWVHSSCDIVPGEGLGSCLTTKCANPQLRVEAQTFLVVNDPSAANFLDYAYDGNVEDGLHQAKALPEGTGKPIVFRGSTTGPKFTERECSPFQVTWSVRPACAKIDIASLNQWCADNVFKEDHAHGVRQLVTSEDLLAPLN